MRVEDGVISPGGVGYDINCLTADAEVVHALGYRTRKNKDTDKYIVRRRRKRR
jgi:RNA-splicing ligase RtcB